MSVRREDTAIKSDEPQAGSFWIPLTPAKRCWTDRQPICTNWGKHQTLQANWLETEILAPTNPVDQALPTGPGGFVQEPQCQRTPACYTSTSLDNASGGIENWHAGIATNSHVFGKDSSTYDKFSYGNLLQAMNSTSSSGFHPQFEGSLFEVPVALTDFIGGSGISTPYFGPRVGSTMSTGNSFPRDQCTIFEADFDATFRMPDTVTDRNPIHSRHFDLNVTPGTITDAASRKSSPIQFEPITPEKTKRGEYSQESEMKHSSIDGVPTRKNNKTTGSGVMQLHEKEKSLLVNEQLCEVSSRQLQENHKPDNGMVEPDLVKTPQQKTRRKKHRPKVIIEGQKKNTPIASTERKSVPQGNPRLKRKYAKKDGVNSLSGGRKNGTDSENKTPSPTETPVGKRNYRRPQGLGKPEDTDKETIETTEIQEPRYTWRSCRRSLKFNSDDLVIDEISSDCPPSSCGPFQEEDLKAKDHPETEHCTQKMKVIKKKKDMVNSHVCTLSMNKLLEESISRDEQHPQSSLPSINKNTEKENHMLIDQTACTRGKCPIVFSEKPVKQWIPKSPSDSMGSSTCLTPEKQIRGLKIQNTDNTAEAELCSRNETGILYNSLQAYLTVFTQNADNGIPGLHFPVIFKKKRTEKVYSTVTSSMQIKPHLNNGVEFERHTPTHSCRNLFTSPTNQGSCADQSQATNLLTTKHATDGPQNGRQVIEDLLALGPTQRIKRKRSKGPTRQRNLASLFGNCKPWQQSPVRAAAFPRTEQNIELLNKKVSCIEALVADTCTPVATKKRSKRSMPIKARVQNGCNHQIIPGTSLGQPLALTWKSMSPVDLITDKLNRLDLNADSKASEEKYNTFMRYHNYYKEHYALVPFQNSGAVVPFDQVRSKKPRPKVDLDDETTRVWRLLLENINSEGIDGTNDENIKWWEEERRVFNGRANSFIARMHLVQGDRHFSPWKGSVVDSVVGVFLTQNVSDHLSSSAFMSLAARFPAKPSIHLTELDDERLGGEISEPEVFELNSDGTFVLMKEMVNETVCGQNIKTLQEFEDDSRREMNSMKPCQNAYEDDSILEGNLRGQSPDPPLGPVIPCEIMAKKVISLNDDGNDKEGTLSSQTPEISSQNSADSPIAQTTRKSNSSEEEPTVGDKPNWLTGSASVVKLLQMTETVLHGVHGEGNDNRKSNERQYAPPSESSGCSLHNEDHLDNPTVPVKNIVSCQQSSLGRVLNLGAQITDFNLLQKNSKFLAISSDKELCTAEMSPLSSESVSGRTFQKSAISLGVEKIPSSVVCSSSNEQVEINQKKIDNQRGHAPELSKTHRASEKTTYQQNLMDATCSTSNIDISKYAELKEVNSNKSHLDYHPEEMVNGPKSKGRRISKEKENPVDWDKLRKQAHFGGKKRERTERTLDSVDWDAIRCADVHEIAQTIKERGMNNKLAERIKDFLDRIVRDHGSVDLEWLRDVPPDKAKEYLLSIRGLGLKSVECVRLLTLHHLAFPVDTNVGRIAVRLGWVPLQPLPESLQLHLLELYPVLESIQKYLWPRLCKLDQKTLYELHYQMITFGKVFCTKNRPNCNACPMRGECRHFASAYASARLVLPAPQDKSIISATENRRARQNPIKSMDTLQLPSPPTDGLDPKSGVQLKIENSKAGQNPVKSMPSPQTDGLDPKSGVSNYQPIIEEPQSPEPIVEVPATPEPDYKQAPECDIECAFGEDPDEIPTIHLNIEEFTHNLQMIMQHNTELQEGEMSKALVALTSEAASIPVPKLKNVSRLRTEHHVYELPDSHPLLEGMDKREPDDPCPYLLAIWTPGETMDSIEPPEKRCSSQELEKLCTDETCSSCNSIREAKFQTVRGTLLIPCRTAMRGSFPLNGTYFQVNEVFSDHESSLSPMDIPRKLLWNLPRRTVYFGTSISTIFKGLSTEGIQHCFWRGFVCVRGFDRKTRAPRPLIARLHFPASKLAKGKGKVDDNDI